MAAIPRITDVAGRPRAEMLERGKIQLDAIMWHPDCPHRLSEHIPTAEELVRVLKWARELGCTAIHVEPCGSGLMAHALQKRHAKVTAADKTNPEYSFVNRTPDHAFAERTLLVIPECTFNDVDAEVIFRRPWAAVAVLGERPGTGSLAHVSPQVWYNLMAHGIPIPGETDDTPDRVAGGGWLAVDRDTAPSYHWADPVQTAASEQLLQLSLLKGAPLCRRAQELYERVTVARARHGDTNPRYDSRYEFDPMLQGYEWVTRLKTHGMAAIVRPADLRQLGGLLHTLITTKMTVVATEIMKTLPNNTMDASVVHAAMRRLKLDEMPKALALFKVALAHPDLDNPFKRAHCAAEVSTIRLLVHADPPVCHACLATPPLNVLRKCLRCECARYCDTACQEAHWPVHKSQCSKHRCCSYVVSSAPIT